MDRSSSPDPLSPDRLAALTAGADTALDDYAKMVRLAREPRMEPEYGRLRRALIDSKRDVDDYVRLLDATLVDKLEIKALVVELDMTDPANIAARQAVGQDIRAVQSLLLRALRVRDKLARLLGQ